MAQKRFGTARYMPLGDWVRTTVVERVVGIQHRRRDVLAFCDAVRKAEAKGLRYGIDVRPEPTNAHDRNALAVYGYAEAVSWFRRTPKRAEWHVGYIGRDMAQGLALDFAARGVPLAGELYSIYQSDDFIEIKVLVLAPRGHSVSTRNKRRPQ